MHESGIDPTSWASVGVREEAAAGLTGAGLERRGQELAELKAAAAGRESYVEEKVSRSAKNAGKARRRVARKAGHPTQASLFQG